MKELNRTDRLTIATVLVAIILVIGLVTIKQPAVPYTRSIDETITLLGTSTDFVSPGEILTTSKTNPASIMIVDLRSPIAYHTSHIEGAINIPLEEIFEKQNIKEFKEVNKPVILYGKDETEGNCAWLLLKQTGVDNVRVMKGGYESVIMLTENSALNSADKKIDAEYPAYDYKAIMNNFGPSASTPAAASQEPVKMIRKEKKSAAEGGC